MSKRSFAKNKNSCMKILNKKLNFQNTIAPINLCKISLTIPGLLLACPTICCCRYVLGQNVSDY